MSLDNGIHTRQCGPSLLIKISSQKTHFQLTYCRARYLIVYKKNHLTCKCYNFYDLSHSDIMFDNANLLMGKLQLVKGWPMGKEIIPQISFTFIKGGSWQIAVNLDTENSPAKESSEKFCTLCSPGFSSVVKTSTSTCFISLLLLWSGILHQRKRKTAS